MELWQEFGGQPPIRILINYWDCSPEELRERLDAIQREGFSHVSSFVPWQAFEADISHKLHKFLQTVAERRLGLTLILSPEVGIHALHSGVPRDLASAEDGHARRVGSGACVVPLAPRWHALPSLHSLDFMKRYWAFLARFLGFLSDLDRSQSAVLKRLSVGLTGSFWKYYRSPLGPGFDFGGISAGDEGKAGTAAFLKYLSEYYAQREFADPDAAAAQRWKTQAYEDLNRRIFAQNAEDQFRRQSEQILLRRYLPVPLEHIELYTPEADPGYLYSAVLQVAADGKADFSRLSRILDSSATRETAVDRRVCRPCVHWTAFAGFQTLSDSERQFLLLKSLLLMASRGGAVFLEDREWRRLSRSFRKRADLLSRHLAEGRLRLSMPVLQLVPHVWSPAEGPWTELGRILGGEARAAATLDVLKAHPETRLVVVDPKFVLRVDQVRELLDWAESGGAVAIPHGALQTGSARTELSARLGFRRDSDVGASRHHAMGRGQVIFYEADESGSWHGLAVDLLERTGIKATCRLSDGRLQGIALEAGTDARSAGVFVLNGTPRTVSGDVLFGTAARVSDLAMSLSESQPVPVAGTPAAPSTLARRVSLEVPSCGVIPLRVRPAEAGAEVPLETAVEREDHATSTL
ncbi:MAG TPA: hypothetical protein VL588_10660 [Bdellovibrionota bacterium]|jgi:hypothetical protein|nr:hypothetical protein [Bdellovibrionota bacterium]